MGIFGAIGDMFGGGSDMGTGAAKETYGQAKDYGKTFNQRGTQSWNAMYPQIVSEASNPKGFSDQQMATMNTANSQSSGGANAGLAGQGALMAGRTRNPGSMAAGLAEAARTTSRNENASALKVQEMNANLAQQKQQAALSALGGLYGQNVSGLNDMMGAQNNAVKEITGAEQAKQQADMGALKTFAGMGMAGAGMAGMGPGGGAAAMNFGSSMMG